MNKKHLKEALKMSLIDGAVYLRSVNRKYRSMEYYLDLLTNERISHAPHKK